IIWVGDRDQAAPADVIIVLGAAAYDAKLSPVFEERIRHGLSLYYAGYAPKLIFTGGFGGTGARFSESQVAERYALRHGVPGKDVLIETVSRTTRQNLVEARALMQREGMRRAIIVSDPLHMARALRLCRELGIDALASSTPSTRFRSFHTRWRFLLQEL
ncbi:protein sanA-like protein, partial [Kosakonia sp. H7A]|uniref:YdcF family protein n=1 Tax=Kosakonia sp. H7A TaxID=2054598 RepID=UPI000D15EF78